MNLTSELQQSLEEAKLTAQENGFHSINVPILWKTMLNNNKNVVRIYEQIEQNPEFLDKYVTKQLTKMTDEGPTEERDGFQMQEDLLRLLNHSEKIAELMGDDALSPEMIIIGIMDFNDEPIQQYLRKKNFTKADVIYGVQKLRGGKTVTQNSRSQKTTSRPSSSTSQDPQKAFEEMGLEAYGRDLVRAANNGELDPVIGRDKEIRDVIRILSRKSKNNPLLIGEPGVGKSAIVEGLAQRISQNDVPDHIKNKQIFSLDMGSVVAGASFRGEFEERLKSILDIVKESEGEIILYIDEIHNVISAGDSGGGMNAGNLLKPMLARGEVRTIGATTIDEYREHFEKDKALDRRFQRIYVNEPSEEETLAILRGLKQSYEDHHGVTIDDEALKAAVTLSNRYMNERQLPDKAIDLLDEASAMFHVAKLSHPTAIDLLKQEIKQLQTEIIAIQSHPEVSESEKSEQLLQQLTDLKIEYDRMVEQWEIERELMRDLDEVRTAYKEAQENYQEAEAQLDVDSAYELREDIIPSLSEDVSIMEEQLQTLADTNQRLLPNTVSEEQIAEVVSLLTGIPSNRLVEEERERLITLGRNMKQSVIGQDDAIEKVEDAVIRAYAQVQDPAKPLGSFLFLGPTGVGKTELAKTLAENLFGSEDAMTRIDMSEYMEKHSVSRLVGAPPGYVGYDEGGQLTEAVRHKPYTIVLLDEIEKAHPDVFNILLQVLDDGRITDASGRVVDFKNTIIIMTSNIGSNEMLDAMERDGKITEETRKIVERLLKNNLRPEFLNRIDEILLFSPLTQEVIIKILAKMLRELNDRLQAQDIRISVPEETQEWIAEQAYNPAFGARPLQRYIMREIETPLAHAIVSQEVIPGDTITLEVQNGKLTFENN